MKDVAIGLLWGLLAVAAAGCSVGLVQAGKALVASRRARKKCRGAYFAAKQEAKDWRNEWKP